MAMHSQNQFQTQNSPKWKKVCIRCLQDNPRDKSLLKTPCFDVAGHGHLPRVQVWWWAEKSHLELYDYRAPGKIPRIRPMPRPNFDGKFSLCDPSRCWGDRCKFAHSIEEREIWNAKKFKPKLAPKFNSKLKLAFPLNIRLSL